MASNQIFTKARVPEDGGYPGFNPRTVVDNELSLQIEHDATITLRDGTKIYADVYKPAKVSKSPVILIWSPYGKHVNPILRWNNLPGSGVPTSTLTKYAAFESPDPGFWCQHGYAVVNVDPRGLWHSEGNASFFSDQEAQDCYDAIEWAGTQEWSQGSVGMTGVSYLAWSQWRVAALNPPHLKAINPNEGVTDFYRELAYHGGINSPFIHGIVNAMWGFGRNQIEDLARLTDEHPLLDDYWKAKNADLSAIKVPAYVVAGWGDFGLHLRGTLEGFKKISSTQKWLRVHGRRKFPAFYEDQERQRQFFDKFLKGVESEVDYWPKVNLEIRERFYVGNYREEQEWPLARTQYTKLFLHAESQAMALEPSSKSSKAEYDVSNAPEETEKLGFDYVFPKDTELTGHFKLRLWVEAQGNDDMDIFVNIDKIDRTGHRVEFPWRTLSVDGPIAGGWLRVSHRELDEQLSTPHQPVLKHTRELKLKPGEIVPVEIEIWASSILCRKGERIRLVLKGSDPDPGREFGFTHPKTLNKGSHVVYTGGSYDSHLLVPVIP
ncbi:hypothetical protein NX059_001626 [Plenodomus lindquistii]|nr:hypothetical protein NX059_001626 [Plenodomus lindquistii]